MVQVIVKGNKPKHITKLIAEVAVEFYLDNLLGSRLSRHVEVTLKFRRNLFRDEKTYGYLETNDEVDAKPPRSFDIVIDSGLSFRTSLLTLAHECVHVKQFARR